MSSCLKSDARSFLYGPRDARSVLSRPRANIPQYGPRARLVRGEYILLTKHEGRTGRISARGLENAARDRRPRAAFSSPRSQFFTIRTSQPANNI